MEAHFRLFVDVLQRFTRLAQTADKKPVAAAPTTTPLPSPHASESQLPAARTEDSTETEPAKAEHAKFGPLHAIIILQFAIIVLLLLKVIGDASPEL